MGDISGHSIFRKAIIGEYLAMAVNSGTGFGILNGYYLRSL